MSSEWGGEKQALSIQERAASRNKLQTAWDKGCPGLRNEDLGKECCRMRMVKTECKVLGALERRDARHGCFKMERDTVVSRICWMDKETDPKFEDFSYLFHYSIIRTNA